MKYRKKPVEIEAIQWNGTHEGFDLVCQTMGINALDIDDDRILLETDSIPDEKGMFRCIALVIATSEGEMRASPNDWIIKGVKGEFYPCKPDIFELTYEQV